ncbi:DUF6327 family protein [Bizionia myxarmorum]|uniref:Uncharacterized protein n=1 Tax=Bizionia myxarmorum TaxID=291186 RepID=A0A5D0REN7_9FLAO|nr:DUF6327 family protein [Bizionia myxarmorum]TYB79479.1 hypothetical protein ES674_06885 [Bizionia myxarmorum]
MTPNSFNSFEEIDNQLQILSLQKQIYKERIKLSIKSSKINLKPVNIKNEFKGLLQEQLITFLRDFLLEKLKGHLNKKTI